jgi:hypothetical protein
MKTEVRDITPSVAKEMLKRNPNNRGLSDSHVKFLAREMMGGNWMFDGQPIRLTEAGGLLDGQHRLNAVVESGTTQKFLIVSGIESAAFKVMDTGKVRSAADVFGINGIKNAAVASATAKFIMGHEMGYATSDTQGAKISNTDILAYYKKTPKIEEYIGTSGAFYKAFDRILTSSHIAGYRYLMGKKNYTKSDEFWNKVCYGLGLEKGCPAGILRKKLIADKMATASLGGFDKKAIIIKAWNAYIKGQKLVYIRYNRELEPYPAIM